MHFIKGVFPNLFGKNEWEFFTGQTIVDASQNVRLPRWVQADRAEMFAMFSNLFMMLTQQLKLEDEGLWAEFSKSDTPEKLFPSSL